MSTLDTTTGSVAPPSEGTPAQPGQATGSLGASGGQPGTQATPGEQPSGAEESSGADRAPFDKSKAYDALLPEYTRLTQQIAPLSKHGNLAAIQERLDWITQLAGDPGFQEWAKSRMAMESAGASDPETQAALSLIERLVGEKVDERTHDLSEYVAAQRIQSSLSHLDQKYGADVWHPYKPQMLALLQSRIEAGVYSPDVNTNPTPDVIEDLFLATAARDEGFLAKVYERKLKTLKRQESSTSQGAPATAVGGGKIDSFEAAFAAAKRDLKM